MLELIFRGFIEWIYGMMLECWEYFLSALLDIMCLDFSYLKSNIPVIEEMMQVILAVGWALLLGNLVFQATKSMLSGLGFEGEDPKLLFARTFVFSFLLLASPQICEIGLNMTSSIMALLEIPEAVNVQLVDKSAFGSLTAAWLLVIVCDVILMFKVMKLLVEIAERYIVLAMLTITAPLAFATGGSRNTSDIFSGWCRMFGSMCLLMATHVIFFKMLLSVVSTIPSGIAVLPWMVLVFGIVKAAKKADSIITRIGLNPALTGGGGRSLSSMVTYAVVRGAAKGVSNALGKPSGGGTKGGRSGGKNPPGGGRPKAGGPLGGSQRNTHFGAKGKKQTGSGTTHTYTGGDRTAHAQQTDTSHFTRQQESTQQAPGHQTSSQKKPAQQTAGGTSGPQAPMKSTAAEQSAGMQVPVQQSGGFQTSVQQQTSEVRDPLQQKATQQVSGSQTTIQQGAGEVPSGKQGISRQPEKTQHQRPGSQATKHPQVSPGGNISEGHTAGMSHVAEEKRDQARAGAPQQDRKTSVPTGAQRGASHIQATAPLGGMKRGNPVPPATGAKEHDKSVSKTTVGSFSTEREQQSTQVSDTRSTHISAQQEHGKTEVRGVSVQGTGLSAQLPHPMRKGGEGEKREGPVAEGHREGQLRSTQRCTLAERSHGTEVVGVSHKEQPGTAGTAKPGAEKSSAQQTRYSKKPVKMSEPVRGGEKRPSPVQQESGAVLSKVERSLRKEQSGPVRQERAEPSASVISPARGATSLHRPGTAGMAPESKGREQKPLAARQSTIGETSIATTPVKQSGPPATVAKKGQTGHKAQSKPHRTKGGGNHGR